MEAALALNALAASTAGSGGAAQAGYGISMTDVAGFEQALERARGSAARGLPAAPVTVTAAAHAESASPGMQALFRPLEQINGQAAQLSAQAQAAFDEGRALTPSEMVMLTVKCHEFMFHCQLTANAANRTSDGLQQLFRQQA
jgi:hypothetical protein